MIRQWPRFLELAIAVWLMLSGWIIDPGDPTSYRTITAGAGITVIVLDLLSLTLRVRYAYLLILVVAGALLASVYWALPRESQGAQNLMVSALMLALLAILPTEATEPPASWREYNRRARV